jgi:N-hydroxyarylamine O-acetyltransferase
VRVPDDVVTRYLTRIGLDGADTSVATLVRAHVAAIPYENLDVRLGREIRIDREGLIAKLLDGGRGGYCFEQNGLFAAMLEALGYDVTRCLGRVRLGDATSARPATHMVLLVDGVLVDVGFGSATPSGPVPIDGEATYGPWTWRTERTRSPEGDDVWLVSLGDMALYTFTETPRHPIDYITPNHFTATHPQSLFTNVTIVQRWDGDTQVGLINGELTIRHPDFTTDVERIEPADYGEVLRARFGLALGADDIDRLVAATFGPAATTSGPETGATPETRARSEPTPRA